MVSQLEFDTVLHVLDRYLTTSGRVLDLAKDEYFQHLTHRGFQVDLPRSADVTRLDLLSDQNFQAVLCLGPYCQLGSREKRRRCLLECRRVLGEGGVVALLYLNRAFALGALVRDGVSLSEGQYRSLFFGFEAEPRPPFGSDYLTSPEEVEAEVASCGLRVVDHIGVDGIYDYFPDAVGRLGPEAYQDFLWYHLRTCGLPSVRGLSRHGLVILEKC